MKRLGIIATLILIAGILASNFGISILFRIATHIVPIEYSEINGSLFSNHIHIPKLYYKTSPNSEIEFKDIHIRGINVLKGTILDVDIKTVNLPLQALSAFTTTGSSTFSLRPRSIYIDTLNLHTHPLAKPLELNQIHISYALSPSMSFYYKREPYEISLDRRKYDKRFLLKLLAQNYLVALSGYVDENGFYFDSTEESDLQDAHIRYTEDNQALAFSVEHDANDQVIQGKGIISPEGAQLNIEDIHFRTDFQNIQVKGSLDTKKKYFYFDAYINGSRIKSTLLDDDTIIVAGYISELASITPYMEGDCTFNLEYTEEGVQSFFAYAKSLYLPMSKISDVQLSYDAKSPRYLNMSAAQLRNPLILMNNPSLTIQKSKQGDQLSMIGFNHGKLQQITATLSPLGKRDQSQITLDKFVLETPDGERWALEADPITLSESLITAPKIHLSFKDQHIKLDGHYNKTTQSWLLNHTFDNTRIRFNSQGIIDADTEFNIHDAVLNAKATAQSSRKEGTQVNGYYDLSNVSASVLNITPRFLFPLDYEMHNSHIHWKNGKVDAELKSDQGNVHIKHRYHGHNITSQGIRFEHHKNSVAGSIDIKYGDDNSLKGKMTITEANFVLNPDEAFESFPKDIDIVGVVATAKPGSSDMDVNLEIFSHNAPLYLFGFNGNADTHLTIEMTKNKPMMVTGELTLHDPYLTLLNRSIKLKTFHIGYHRQPWLKGQLNLTLEQPVVITSAGSQMSNTDVHLSAYGPIDSPSFSISSAPVTVSQLEAFTYVFAASDQLPEGNENYALLEAISGLKRNQGIVVLIQSITHVSKVMGVDISLRPEYSQNQTFSEGFSKSDLTVTRRINDNTLMIFRRQLNEESGSAAINYRFKPWLSGELQYNRGDNSLTASLFYWD